MSENKFREDGYYWVKYKPIAGGEWHIAEWIGGIYNQWALVMMEDGVNDDEFEEIDETPIKRNV